MALRTAQWRRGGRAFCLTAGLTGLTLLAALGGCNSTIEALRSLRGISKDDPNPATAPFTRNMAVAEAGPYPNLASVPPPPTRATSTAERQQLTQSLLADRAATAADAGPAATPRPAAAKRPAGSASAASAATAAPATSERAANSGRRKPDVAPASQPLEASLKMPQIPSVPQPEAARPAPPPPRLPAVPPAAKAPIEALPAATASAMPEPAPPVPVLAPIAPPPAAKLPPEPAPAAATVATFAVTGAARGAERSQIDRVAALYRKTPGSVRVIAYAAAPAPGRDPLAGYHAALDRAQAVAKALAAAGIPAGKIQTQAAPAAGANGAGRVEIQLAP
jgi:hypothetical protein